MSTSNYPIWWNTTVTIYNKHIDAETDVVTWYRTVVDNCFWQLTGTEVSVGEIALDSKSIVCRIPKDSRFLEKQDWVEVPNEDKDKYFTLAQNDIIVKGNCKFDIDEYSKSYRSSDLLNHYREYQACMVVTEYSNNTGEGRCTEHYLARGK